MIEICRSLPRELQGFHESSPRSKYDAARQVERVKEMLARSKELQADFDKYRYHCGLPAAFLPVPFYNRGVSPLNLPNSSFLQSWHASSLGMLLGSAMVQTLGPDPTINFDADVQTNIALRLDITLGGPRGTATYGLTFDGSTYFQTGVTAISVPVPLLGRTLTFNVGSNYTLGNQYFSVGKTCTNQTPKPRTLVGPVTDSVKPRTIPNAKNGYPALLSQGGTTGAFFDNTSTWANELTSGGSFACFYAGTTDSAIPPGVQCFWSAGNTGAIDPDPCYYLGVRNATGVYRGLRINDANATSFRESVTIADINYNLMTVLVDSNNVTIRRNGTVLVAGLSIGSGATTCDAMALWCLFRNNAQTNAMGSHWLEFATYSTGSSSNWTAGNLSIVENYFINKYNLP